MKTIISSAAFAASEALSQQGLAVKRSHLGEVIAALLGYRTFAALRVEEADISLPYHLKDAQTYVLNVPMADQRAQAIGEPRALAACLQALKNEIEVPVFDGIDDFFDSHARETLEDAIYNGEYVAGAMAESNASFPDYPVIDLSETSGDLWAAPTSWSLEVKGTLTGEYDPDGDRMYNGDTLNVWGKATYQKAGRAGLILLEDIDEGALADESWREEDRADGLEE